MRVRGYSLKNIPEFGFLPAAEELADTEAIFGREAPVCIEVGCGNGHFLTELSQHRPERNYIGIDLRGQRIEKSCRKVKNLSIENLKFVHGDAVQVLEDMFEDNFLQEMYVNFPDPWPKYRHKENRLNKFSFVQLMVRKLRSGGLLYWVCDYFPQIVDVVMYCKQLEQDGVLRNKFVPEGYALQHDGYFSSLYEEKWREMGRKIFYVCFEKI